MPKQNTSNDQHTKNHGIWTSISKANKINKSRQGKTSSKEAQIDASTSHKHKTESKHDMDIKPKPR